jgi:hypothetical protein
MSMTPTRDTGREANAVIEGGARYLGIVLNTARVKAAGWKAE